jgi:hypothetical protein
MGLGSLVEGGSRAARALRRVAAVTPKRTFTGLAIVGIALAIAGCDQFVDAIQKGAEAAANDGGVAGEAPLTEDDKLGNKLNPYIDCINNTSRRVLDSGQRYQSWIDPAKGLTGTEQNVYGLYEVDDQKACVDGIKTANDAEPEDAEMEAVASEYAAAFAEVQPLVAEAYTYYQEKNYEDDKFAKGKELHPKLIAAFEKFTAVDQKLRLAVRERNEGLQQRELERIEKEDGRKLLFHNKNVMAKAKVVVETADVPDWKQLDLAKFEPVFEDFEKALEECEKYAKDHKPETDSITMFSSFTGDAGEFKMAAKELIRRKRDNKEYSDSDKMWLESSPERVEGHPAKVSATYNDLVSTSNSLNWHWYKPDP